jgi:hypothetical protein
MSRPQLVQRFRSSTNAQLGVFKWVNGSLIQVGNDFGSDTTSTDFAQQLNNRVVQWNGILYSVGFDYLWKFDPAGSGVWGAIFDYTDAAILGNEVGRYTPIMPMDVGGENKLVFAVTDSSNNFVAIHMDINETFEVQAPLSVTATAWDGTNDSQFMKNLIHKGNWAWLGIDNGNVTRLWEYNPNGNTINESTFSVGYGAANNGDICPFQGQLYLVGGDASTKWQLFRIEGSNVVPVVQLHGTNKFGNASEPEASLYTDGNFLFALIKLDATQDGWYLKQIQIDPTGITTWDRTPNLPQHLIHDNGVTSRSNSWWGMCYTDLESNPGGLPEINQSWWWSQNVGC